RDFILAQTKDFPTDTACLCIRLKIGQRHTIAHNFNLSLRIIVISTRLTANHLRIGDHLTRAAPEQGLLKLKGFPMLCIESIQKPARPTENLSSAPQPCLMNPVSRPVNIASPNTLKTEDKIALRFGFNSFKFIGKSLRRLTTQPGDWPPGPFATGPGGVG